MAKVVISRQAAASVRRGHPWVFRSSLLKEGPSEAKGSRVRIFSEDGDAIGAGIYDANSPLAVRVWALGDDARLDASVFRERLVAALAVRRTMFSDATTAYRILNGEGDRTPGFVIDRYADVAVLRIDGDAARDEAEELTRDLESVLRDAGVTTLLERGGGRRTGRDAGEEKTITARFGPMREHVEVKEHGVPFVVDLVAGQKTGAFLDQRENRRRIQELVERRSARGSGTRVLNLFSYTGGFSLRAALGGGTVTSVDIATRAHATAQASFKLAGVDPKRHTFVAADAFAWLAEAKRKKEKWDVVISDPPSFAPNERAKTKALSAYRALHQACADVLANGGHFVAASCSSHVTLDDFLSTLDDAALQRHDLRLLDVYGPPGDHPTLPVFREGRYLKLAILA